MKPVATLLILLTAMASYAAPQACTIEQIKKEGRNYFASKNILHKETIQECLKAAIDKDAELNSTLKDKSMDIRVLNVLAEIKHAEMAGLIKCETTHTPGCLSEEKKPIFTAEDEKLLERDADLKREAVRKAKENGEGIDD